MPDAGETSCAVCQSAPRHVCGICRAGYCDDHFVARVALVEDPVRVLVAQASGAVAPPSPLGSSIGAPLRPATLEIHYVSGRLKHRLAPVSLGAGPLLRGELATYLEVWIERGETCEWCRRNRAQAAALDWVTANEAAAAARLSVANRRAEQATTARQQREAGHATEVAAAELRLHITRDQVRADRDAVALKWPATEANLARAQRDVDRLGTATSPDFVAHLLERTAMVASAVAVGVMLLAFDRAHGTVGRIEVALAVAAMVLGPAVVWRFVERAVDARLRAPETTPPWSANRVAAVAFVAAGAGLFVAAGRLLGRPVAGLVVAAAIVPSVLVAGVLLWRGRRHAERERDDWAEVMHGLAAHRASLDLLAAKLGCNDAECAQCRPSAWLTTPAVGAATLRPAWVGQTT